MGCLICERIEMIRKGTNPYKIEKAKPEIEIEYTFI